MDRREFNDLPIDKQRQMRTLADLRLEHNRRLNDLRAECPCGSCAWWRGTEVGKVWMKTRDELRKTGDGK